MRPGLSRERETGEDELRDTQRRVAEITRRVNYFVGIVRMSCGKRVRGVIWGKEESAVRIQQLARFDQM